MTNNETDNVIKTRTATNILLGYRNSCSYDENYLDCNNMLIYKSFKDIMSCLGSLMLTAYRD